MEKEEALERMIAVYGKDSKMIKFLNDYLKTWESNEWNRTTLKILVESHELAPCKELITK